MIRKWFRKKPLNVLEGGTGANTFEQACENLGAVKNTGDIIRGDLQVYDNTNLKETMRLKSNGNLIFYKEPNGSNSESYAIQFKDEADGEDYYGHIDIIASAPESENNKRSIRLTSHSKNIPAGFSSKALNTLELGVDDSGTRTVYVSSPEAWRTAISAAASSHNHSASNITSGTLPITRGGTGRTATANGAMYATSAGGAINMGTLPVKQGGTGATTKTAAFKNLASWKKIASVSGTKSATIDLSGYYEVMIVGWYSTTYIASANFMVANFNKIQKEVYLGGGYATGGSRRAVIKLSTTKFTGVQMAIDEKTVTGNYILYAR